MSASIRLRYPDEFRVWYYDTIVGRDWDGRPNTNMRRGMQEMEQAFYDAHRKHMGYDAPWINVDMVPYDDCIPKALIEVKINEELWLEPNRLTLINLGRMSKLRVYLFRVKFSAMETYHQGDMEPHPDILEVEVSQIA